MFSVILFKYLNNIVQDLRIKIFVEIYQKGTGKTHAIRKCDRSSYKCREQML